MLMISGSVANYARNMQLTQKAQRRMSGLEPREKNNQPEETAMQRDMRRMREDAERQAEAAVVEGVVMKLRSGMELSSRDMDILREKSPEMYLKAIQVASERRAYEKRLSQCRTKDEVKALNTSRMQSFVGQIKTVSQMNVPLNAKMAMIDEIGMRVNGLRSEHHKFVQSKRYADLPWEHELKEKKKGKKAGSEGRTKTKETAYVQLEDRELEQKLEKMLREERDKINAEIRAEEEKLAKGQKQENADGKTEEKTAPAAVVEPDLSVAAAGKKTPALARGRWSVGMTDAFMPSRAAAVPVQGPAPFPAAGPALLAPAETPAPAAAVGASPAPAASQAEGPVPDSVPSPAPRANAFSAKA